MDRETKDIIIASICSVIAIGVLIGGFWYMDVESDKKKECLKPFAEKYCEERGFVLKRNNAVLFFCAEDMRSGEVRYDYLQSELNYCDSSDA